MLVFPFSNASHRPQDRFRLRHKTSTARSREAKKGLEAIGSSDGTFVNISQVKPIIRQLSLLVILVLRQLYQWTCQFLFSKQHGYKD